MKFDIVHEGVVREVRGRMVTVGIEAAGACSGCKVQGLCGLSGEKEKEVAVWDSGEWTVGERVVVGVGSAMAMKAVVWAYVVPLFVMLAVLFSTKGFGDLVSGLSTLGSVAVYYVVLWFFRGRLERDIIFKIGRIE